MKRAPTVLDFRPRLRPARWRLTWQDVVAGLATAALFFLLAVLVEALHG